MKNNIIFAILIIIASFIINLGTYVSPSFAATDIFATTTESALWTKANSPYIIHSSLVVLPDAVLTIEPGTTVEFQAGKSGILNVTGQLIAQGTATDTITFTSSLDGQGTSTPKVADWQGILFNGTESPNLSYLTIRYADVALNFYGQKNILLSHFAFDHVNEAFAAYEGSVLKASALTSENSTGQGTFSLYEGSSLDLSDSVLGNGSSRYGVAVYESSTTLSNVLISGNNTGSGLTLFGGTASLSSTTISHFQTGLLSYDDPTVFSAATATKSHFISNGIGIQSYGGSLSISQSTVASNTQYGVLHQTPDPVDLRNNYWGDPSGPAHPTLNPSGLGNAVSDNVTFIPFLTHEPSDATTTLCCSNVLFIPGIESSRLYKKGSLYEDQLWEPNFYTDVEDLYLDKNGESKNKAIYTRDIIGKTNICGCALDEDIYDTFERSLDRLASSGAINNWKPYPYDWRLDMNTLIASGTEEQDGTFQKITDLLASEASSSKTGKVTVVAHSNGGLFLKLLLSQLQTQKNQGKNNLIDKIDTVVMVASPQYGTPLALAGLLHGDEQKLYSKFFMGEAVARGLGENMPTSYGLLPSSDYFQQGSTPIIFDTSLSKLKPNFLVYGNSISDRKTLDSFLLAGLDHRSKPDSSDLNDPNVLNAKLLSNSDALHQVIDNFVFPASIKVYTIAGTGVQTLSGIKYFAKPDCLFASLDCSYVLDRTLLHVPEGDGTVIALSALGNSANQYYLDLQALSNASGIHYEHKNIMEAEPVEDFIANVLKGAKDLPIFMTKQVPDYYSHLALLNVSTHSPVSLDVYDVHGNHVGLSKTATSTGELKVIDEDIPGSSYYSVGDENYISVPTNAAYTIKVNGLDTGVFSLDLDKTVGGSVVSTSTFVDIPVSSSTQAFISIAPTSSTPSLTVDPDGSGLNTFQVQAGDSVDPVIYLQILEKTISNLHLKSKLQDELIMKINKYIDLIKQGKIKQANTKISLFSKRLGQSRRWYKNLSAGDRATIIDQIDGLVDGL